MVFSNYVVVLQFGHIVLFRGVRPVGVDVESNS